MSWAPFLLLGVGLLLIFIEFYLPGGIMGVAGGVMIVASIVVFAMQSDSLLLIILFLIGALFFVALLIRFALYRLKSGKAKGIFLSTVQEGYVASSFDESLVGKVGEAFSDLKPSGHVLVDGKRRQAVSKTGYVVKGSKIEVVGGQGAHLLVKQLKEV